MSDPVYLVSVDLDYFNICPLDDLYAIFSRAHDCGVKNVTLNRDHTPVHHCAWGKRYGTRDRLKGVHIWNYDEHDDYADCHHEHIGNWTSYCEAGGAIITWVTHPKKGYVCRSARRGKRNYTRLAHGSLPPRIDALAFFTSPGYSNDVTLVYHVACEAWRHDLTVNGRKAGNLPIKYLRWYLS
jgi:hypothetical protein